MVKIIADIKSLLNLKLFVKTYKFEIKLVKIENHKHIANKYPSTLFVENASTKSGKSELKLDPSIAKFTKLIIKIKINVNINELIIACFFEKSLPFSKIKLLENTML